MMNIHELTDPALPKNEWSLSEGFVVAEANDLLPAKTVDRTNLVDCYQALLLAALMEAGLFDVSIINCCKCFGDLLTQRRICHQ